MSWNHEVIIVAGYKLDSDVFSKGAEKWEEMAFDKNGDESLQKYEDYFIDTDPISGRGPFFFGKILRCYGSDDDYCPTEELNSILTPLKDIDEIREIFHLIFDEFLDGSECKFSKWITNRWI